MLTTTEALRQALSRLPAEWRISHAFWTRVERLLPARPEHPLNCHNPRVPDWAAFLSILIVLRTGAQWAIIDLLFLPCLKSAAYRRFQEWGAAGVFRKLWLQGILNANELSQERAWILDCQHVKAPYCREKVGPSPVDRAKSGSKRSLVTTSIGRPAGFVLAGGNTPDYQLAAETLARAPVEPGDKLRADRGYDWPEVDELISERELLSRVIRKSAEAPKKPGLGKRWPVERTNARSNHFRRLRIRDDRLDTTSTYFHELGYALIAHRMGTAY